MSLGEQLIEEMHLEKPVKVFVPVEPYKPTNYYCPICGHLMTDRMWPVSMCALCQSFPVREATLEDILTYKNELKSLTQKE